MNQWLNLIRLELEKKKKIYIKGTGIEAKKLFYVLLQCGIPVAGFLDNSGSVLYGLPVCQKSQFDDSGAYIVDFQNICVQGELRKIAEKKKFFWTEDGGHYECNAPLVISMLLSRCRNQDTVMIVNSDSKEFWENLAATLMLKTVDFIVIDHGMDVLYELCYLDTKDLVVAVCVRQFADEINKVLEGIGLRKTINIIYVYNSFSGNVTDGYEGFDWLLGNTYNPETEFPGFTLLQNQFADDKSSIKKIVILGNSATDPLFYPQKSWPEYLAEKLDTLKCSYIIYNGAITDYSSTNELYKLIRDVLCISPDVVISYGGFIDFREYVELYPYVNLNLMRTASLLEERKKIIHGVADVRVAYQRWLDNEQMMQAFSDMHGIRFYGILQPWIGSEGNGQNRLLEEWYNNYWSVVFPQFGHLLENASQFKINIETACQDNAWLKDFTSIFKGIPEWKIYYDSIHVNERGNEMVAERVFREIFSENRDWVDESGE